MREVQAGVLSKLGAIFFLYACDSFWRISIQNPATLRIPSILFAPSLSAEGLPYWDEGLDRRRPHRTNHTRREPPGRGSLCHDRLRQKNVRFAVDSRIQGSALSSEDADRSFGVWNGGILSNGSGWTWMPAELACIVRALRLSFPNSQ